MAFGLLTSKTKPLIGVDISSSAVKMLELAATGDGARRVERYAIAKLPREAVTEGNIAKPEAVEQAMRNAWEALGTIADGGFGPYSRRLMMESVSESSSFLKKGISSAATSFSDLIFFSFMTP